MLHKHAIIYRFLILGMLGILAFYIGGILAYLHSGRITLSLSADSGTLMVAIAETLIAFAIAIQVALEGSSFLLESGRTIMTRSTIEC